LILIAARITDTLRNIVFPLQHEPLFESHESHSIFRIGGDEFRAMLDEFNREQISYYAGRLIEAVHKPYLISKHRIEISCSVGISQYPEETRDEQLLIKYADLALYKAKETKNTFVFHSDIVSVS
jgi:diguanylate cyclase (GGDEF)-like protein